MSSPYFRCYPCAEALHLEEVVLSGFQLELYSTDEKVFAYWYTAEIIKEHLSALGNLISVAAQGTILVMSKFISEPDFFW
jgi:hypothetical protein